MSIQQLIDNELLVEQELRATRERSGMWTPSRFGRCFRFQYWSRAKVPESDFPELKMLRRWKVGNLYHAYVQSFFPGKCEVEVRKNDILGFADVVLDNRVIDIKSVSDWEFGYLLKPNYSVEKEKIINCLQVSTYSWILDKPLASLYFINTKSSSGVEFDVNISHFIPLIEEELNILRGYWEDNRTPSGIPRAYGGKECQYCAYKTKCFSLDGDKTKNELLELSEGN
jgi:hypothetical protein